MSPLPLLPLCAPLLKASSSCVACTDCTLHPQGHLSRSVPVAGPAADGLRITAVKPYPTPAGFPGRTMLFVKVECEATDGTTIHGWGESGLSGRELATQGAVQHYAQFLVGQDAMQTGALWQQMYRSQYFVSRLVTVHLLTGRPRYQPT